jgi:hypothetical protein
MQKPHFLQLGALAALLLLASQTAHAEVSAADRAMAETLFRDAKELMNGANVTQACAKFAESHRLDPKLGTLLNLAVCHDKEGKTASAWAEYMDVANQAGRTGQREREQYAQKAAKDAEKRLSRIALAVKAASSGLQIKLDGRPLSEAAWSTPLPVDPGEHVVDATAIGRKAWTSKFNVAAGGDNKVVTVPELAPETVPGGGATAAKAAETSAPSAPVRTNDGSSAEMPSPGGGKRTAGYVAVGVGLVGLGVGAVFGLSAISKRHDAEDLCTQGYCSAKAVATNDEAKSAAWISDVGFGIGIAGVGVGAYLLLTAKVAKPSAAESTAKHLSIAPLLGNHTAGISAGGAF